MGIEQSAPEEVERRLRKVAGDLGIQAKLSTQRGAEVRSKLYISPQFDPDDLQSLDVTVGWSSTGAEPAHSVTIEHSLWVALTAMWEHNSESVVYSESARAIADEFPEVFKW